MLFTNEPVIIASLPKVLPMNYNPTKEGIEKDNNWDSREQHFLKTAVRDRVGQITNLATVYRDMSLNMNNPYLFNKNVITLTFMQGWEIDKAKTGFSFEIPKDIQSKFVPHWMAGVKNKDGNIVQKGVKQLKGREVSEKAELYTSNSPLGKLFDFMGLFTISFQAKIKVQGEDKTVKFIKHVDNAEFSRILPTVKVLEQHYRLDIAQIVQLQKDGMSKDDTKGKYTSVYTKYMELLNTLSSDETAISASVYHAAYNRSNHDSDSYSMPWVCAFNGMLQLMHANGNATRMVKLPSFTDDIVESIVINNSGMLFVNDCPFKMTNYPAGAYEIITIDDAKYILVPKECVYQAEQPILTETPLYQFSICGFKRHGFNGLQVLEMIMANDGQFALVTVDAIAKVFIKDVMVGAFNNRETDLLGEVVNKQFKLISNQEVVYIPKRPTSLTVMHKDGVHAISGSFFVTVVPMCSIDPSDKAYAPVPVSADETFSQSVNEGNYNYSEEAYYDYSECIVEMPYSITSEVVIEPIQLEGSNDNFDVLDETIVDKLSGQVYWNVKTLTKPANVIDFKVFIVNKIVTANDIVGTVEVTATNGTTYSFDVVVNETNTGLKMVSTFIPKSQEFINWILRLVTYKFYTL